MVTQTPKQEVPKASKQATTLQNMPTGTPIPQAKNKKPKTPVLAVPEKYKQGLSAVEGLFTVAIEEDKSFDDKWKDGLYRKLKKLVKVSPEPLREDTERLLADAKLGLELGDKKPLRKALRSIQEIKAKTD